MIAIIAAAVLQAAAGQGARPPGSPIPLPRELSPDSPAWLQTPPNWQTQKLLESIRPDILHSGQPIEAVIECTVKADGFLAACFVTSETPPRSGLGRAALRLMRKFQVKVASPEFPSIAGGTVRIPLRVGRLRSLR